MAKIINLDLVKAGFDGGFTNDKQKEAALAPGVDTPCTETDLVCNGPDQPCQKSDLACDPAPA